MLFILVVIPGLLIVTAAVLVFCGVLPIKTKDLLFTAVERSMEIGIQAVSRCDIEEIEKYRKWSIMDKETSEGYKRYMRILKVSLKRWDQIRRNEETYHIAAYRPVVMNEEIYLIRVGYDYKDIRSTDFPCYSEYKRFICAHD